jgi:hypothetical protein
MFTTLSSDLRQTFINLREVGLKLNLEKCVFGVSRGKMLGYIIGPEGIRANPDKTKSINIHGRAIIQEGSLEAHYKNSDIEQVHLKVSRTQPPFLQSLKGRRQGGMGNRIVECLPTAKNYLATRLMVTVPEPEAPLLLYVAASNHAVSGVLIQEKQEESKVIQQLVYYISESPVRSKTKLHID